MNCARRSGGPNVAEGGRERESAAAAAAAAAASLPATGGPLLAVHERGSVRAPTSKTGGWASAGAQTGEGLTKV